MRITKTNSTSELREHLTNASFDDLRALEMAAWTHTPIRFYYTLTVGDDILPVNPYVDSDNSFTMNVPYMIGRTDDEGGYSMSYYHSPNFLSGLNREEFRDLLVKARSENQRII